MKKFTLIAICLTGFALPVFADSISSISNQSIEYVSSYGYGGTHDVRPYTRRDGTYVGGHRAGNPGSGVHCRNNSCY